MRILGIDPGSKYLGWGCVDVSGNKISHVAHGVIEAPAGLGSVTQNSSDACDFLGNEFEHLLDQLSPQCAALEAFVFFGDNQMTTQAMQTGAVIGVIRESLRMHKIPRYEYPTQTVKFVVCQNRKAEKKDIQERVRFVLGLQKVPRPLHASDALALALTLWSKKKLEGMKWI